MIDKEILNKALSIEIHESKEVFCSNQNNCNDCALDGLINSQAYDQPCDEVYEMVKIIQYLNSSTKDDKNSKNSN